MKSRISLFFLIMAFLVTLAAAFSGEGYSRVCELRALLSQQKEANHLTQSRLLELKSQIFELQHSERALEKAARNEFSLARPDEMVILFDGPQ